MNFKEMYKLVHSINRQIKEGKFHRVEVESEFFKDLEKVFDEVAEEISWYYIMVEHDG